MGALERPNFKISQFRLPCYIPSMIMKRRFSILCASLLLSLTGWAVDTLVLEAKEGPGKGKRVVLISGDEEYRSEEALPMLGKILSQHHGFHCTVVFALDEAGKYIDSNNQQGLRGLAALDGADLMIIATRFPPAKCGRGRSRNQLPQCGQAGHRSSHRNACLHWQR